MTRIARVLAGVRGQKQMVYLSEGFDDSLIFGSSDTLDQVQISESQERGRIWEIEGAERSGDSSLQAAFDAMLEEFRRADTAIQAIDISPGGGGGRATDRRSNSDGLHMLARGTGGESYRDSNDLTKVMQRMLDRTGAYYVLFFQPGDDARDGRYHKLKVKLRDAPRGAKASHRPGYFAPR